MIACDHVNISLVSHNKQNLQEHTQVKMTLLLSQQVCSSTLKCEDLVDLVTHSLG